MLNPIPTNPLTFSTPNPHPPSHPTHPLITPSLPESPSISSLLDTVSKNNLNTFYNQTDSLFKQRIDKLNLKFYLETEKYLSGQSNQNNDTKCQESLFIILFQQINLYIEEIERLNILLQVKKEDPKFIKERFEKFLNKQKEFETKEKLIQTLKESQKILEKKLSKLIINDDKIKNENESLKRQNKFYKEQLKNYLSSKNILYDDKEEKEKEKIKSNYLSNSVDDSNLLRTLSDRRNSTDNNINYHNSNIILNSNTSTSVSGSNNILNFNFTKPKIMDMNTYRLTTNRYSNMNYYNNIPNTTSSIELKNNSNVNNLNNVNINNNTFNKKNKKEVKIIKSVKDQLTRTVSSDTSNSTVGNSTIKCKTFSSNLSGNINLNSTNTINNISNNTQVVNKSNIKVAIQKCDDELTELNILEQYLKKMKNEVLKNKEKGINAKNLNLINQNLSSNNSLVNSPNLTNTNFNNLNMNMNTSLSIIDKNKSDPNINYNPNLSDILVYNENIESFNHFKYNSKPEIMVSDLEDYNHDVESNKKVINNFNSCSNTNCNKYNSNVYYPLISNKKKPIGQINTVNSVSINLQGKYILNKSEEYNIGNNSNCGGNEVGNAGNRHEKVKTPISIKVYNGNNGNSKNNNLGLDNNGKKIKGKI